MSTPDAAQPSASSLPEAAEQAPPPRLLRNKPFARFTTGFGMSLLGDQIWFVALGWSASRLGSPLQTSVVMACASVPRAALILLGGTLSDRYGALRLTLVGQAGRTLTMACACVLLLLVDTGPVLLACTAVVFGTLDAIHMPAAASLPPHLVDRRSLPAAQGAVQTLERTATVAGAPLGGLIVASHGLSVATAVNSLLFLVALVVLSRLKPQVPSEPSTVVMESTWKALCSGLSYARNDPLIGRLLLAVTALNLCLAAPLNMGIGLLASTRGWGSTGFGTLVMGFAAGAIAGALLTAARRSPSRPGAVGLRWTLFCGAATALLPLSPQLPVTVAVAALVGFTTGPAGALLFGLVQARTRDSYRGRIMALATFSALGLTPLSYAVFGALVSAFGLTVAFLSCALTLTVASGLAYANRTLRTAKLTSGEPVRHLQ